MSALHDDFNVDRGMANWRKILRKKVFPWSKKDADLSITNGGILENIMILTYVVNMVTLALVDTYDTEAKGTRNRVIKYFDMVFCAMYLFETIVRCVCFGVTKLRHPLRVLDAIIVVSNFTIIVLFWVGVPNMNLSLLSLRCSVRILRPFLITTSYPSIRIFLEAVTHAVLRLTDVVVMLLFFLTWFGVSVVFSYSGLLQTRCVNELYLVAEEANYSSVNSMMPVPVGDKYDWEPAVSFVTRSLIAENDYEQSDFVCGSELFEESSTFSDLLVTQMYNMQKLHLQQMYLARHSFTASSSPTMSLSPSDTNTNRTAPSESSAPGETDNPNVNVTNSTATVSLTPLPPEPFVADRSMLNATNLQLLEYIEAWYAVRDKISCSVEQTCDPEKKAYKCPFGFSCENTLHNPYDNLVSFDNLAKALVSLYVCVSFQLWYEIMFWLVDSTGFFAYIFFTLFLVVGAFMLVNLTVVILTVEYETAKTDARQKLVQQLEIQKTAAGRPRARTRTQKYLDVLVSGTMKLKEQMKSAIGAAPPPPKPRRRAHRRKAINPPPGDPPSSGAMEQPLLEKKGGEQEEGEGQEEDEEGVQIDAKMLLGEKKDDEQEPIWMPMLSPWRQYVARNIVWPKWFDGFSYFIIIVNTGMIMSARYDMDETVEKVFFWLNVCFTVYYTAEALLRIAAAPFFIFIQSFFNVFDVVVSIVAWCDIFLEELDVPIIGAFRVIRIIKLLKAFPGLYMWIVYIVKVTRSSPVLLLMLFLCMFTFSCVGMQLWGGRLCGLVDESNDPVILEYETKHVVPDNTTNITVYEFIKHTVTVYPVPNTTCLGLPRAHFDTFSQAMITTFQIISADDWNFVMNDCILASGWWVAVPFCLYFYLGNYVLLNIFIAVLMSAGTDKTEEDRIRELQKEQELQQKLVTDAQQLEQEEEKEERERQALLLSQGADDEDDDSESAVSVISSTHSRRDNLIETNEYTTKKGKKVKKTMQDRCIDTFFLKVDASKKVAKRIVQSSVTEVVMGIVILGGSFAEGLEDPIAAPDSSLLQTLEKIDIALTIIYVIEVLINVHAYGLIRKRTSYLRRDPVNVFDFALVVVSVIGVMTASLKSNQIVRGIKVLRALRPLRLVKRSPGMRLVLRALLGSLGELRNVAVIAIMIFAVWGTVGVQMLSGKLRSCYIGAENYPSLYETECNAYGGEYRNDGPHFDNVFAAMMSLFQIATLEGWAGVMYKATDATDVGEPLKRDASHAVSLYFMIIAAFAGLFLINIFISVLIDAYNKEKRKAALQRSLLATQEQDAWLISAQRLARFMPQVEGTKKGSEGFVGDLANQMVETEARIKLLVRNIVRSRPFDWLSMLVVFTNFIIMALQHYPPDKATDDVIKKTNLGFAVFFCAEAVLKIYAESFHGYFSSKWNRLDFVVAIAAIVSAIAEEFINSPFLSLVRTLRVLRLVRLTKGTFSVDKMIGQLGRASLSLGNVFSVILLVYFIFGAIALKVFGRVKNDIFGVTSEMDKHSNFAHIGSALFLLARIMTGGNWADIMWNCAVRPPFCDEDIGECGSVSPIPEIYFVLYVLVSVFVLRNLLIAVLLDGFSSAGQERAITKEHAKNFYRQWKAFDPDMSLTISPFDLIPLLRSLPKTNPLCFNRFNKKQRVNSELKFLRKLEIDAPTKRLPLDVVIDGLCGSVYYVPMPEKASFAAQVARMKQSVLTSLIGEAKSVSMLVAGQAVNIGKSFVTELGSFVSGDKAAGAGALASADDAGAGDLMMGSDVEELKEKAAPYIFMNFVVQQRKKKKHTLAGKFGELLKEIRRRKAEAAERGEIVNAAGNVIFRHVAIATSDDKEWEQLALSSGPLPEPVSPPKAAVAPGSRWRALRDSRGLGGSTARELQLEDSPPSSAVRETRRDPVPPAAPPEVWPPPPRSETPVSAVRWQKREPANPAKPPAGEEQAVKPAAADVPAPAPAALQALPVSAVVEQPPPVEAAPPPTPPPRARWGASVGSITRRPSPPASPAPESAQVEPKAETPLRTPVHPTPEYPEKPQPSPAPGPLPSVFSAASSPSPSPTLGKFLRALKQYQEAVEGFVAAQTAADPPAQLHSMEAKLLKDVLLFGLPFASSSAALVRAAASQWPHANVDHVAPTEFDLFYHPQLRIEERVKRAQTEVKELQRERDQMQSAVKRQGTHTRVLDTTLKTAKLPLPFMNDMGSVCMQLDSWVDQAEHLFWRTVAVRFAEGVDVASARCGVELRHIAPRIFRTPSTSALRRGAAPVQGTLVDAITALAKLSSILREIVTQRPTHAQDPEVLTYDNSELLHLLRETLSVMLSSATNAAAQPKKSSVCTPAMELSSKQCDSIDDCLRLCREWTRLCTPHLLRDGASYLDAPERRPDKILQFCDRYRPTMTPKNDGGEASGQELRPTLQALADTTQMMLSGLRPILQRIFPKFIERSRLQSTGLFALLAYHEQRARDMLCRNLQFGSSVSAEHQTQLDSVNRTLTESEQILNRLDSAAPFVTDLERVLSAQPPVPAIPSEFFQVRTITATEAAARLRLGSELASLVNRLNSTALALLKTAGPDALNPSAASTALSPYTRRRAEPLMRLLGTQEDLAQAIAALDIKECSMTMDTASAVNGSSAVRGAQPDNLLSVSMGSGELAPRALSNTTQPDPFASVSSSAFRSPLNASVGARQTRTAEEVVKPASASPRVLFQRSAAGSDGVGSQFVVACRELYRRGRLRTIPDPSSAPAVFDTLGELVRVGLEVTHQGRRLKLKLNGEARTLELLMQISRKPVLTIPLAEVTFVGCQGVSTLNITLGNEPILLRASPIIELQNWELALKCAVEVVRP